MYKGLCETQMGFQEDAIRSIRNGWKLVDEGRGGAGVGRALERVQGPRRAWLEGLRNEPQPSELADRTLMLEMNQRLSDLERKLADANRRLADAEKSRVATAAPVPAPVPPVPAPAVAPPPATVVKPPATAPRTKPAEAPAVASAAPVKTPMPLAPAPKPVDSGAAITLRGSGATFPASLYKVWFEEFHKLNPDIAIDYQSLGSGAGVRTFIQQQVDFGASDAAISDEEIAQVPDGVTMVPVTAGAIALAYNVPDAPEVVNLSRDVYSGIFLGEIVNWNDPKIAACNDGAAFPDLPITVVRRAVSSGTTFLFTRHLGAVSQAWADGPGVGTTVAWPTGVPAKKNSDIADRIRQTPGAIGYLEYGFAAEAKLAIAALQNNAGNYIRPLPENTSVALGEIVLPANLRGFISDPAGAEAYPIVGYTWLLCYQKYEDKNIAAALKKFLNYALSDGQKHAADLGYIPLPEDVSSRIVAHMTANVGRAEVARDVVAAPVADAAAPAAMEIAGVALKGAGATFPANLYKKWFEDFQGANPGTTVAYQATGSGAGVRNFIQSQVDFGASDAAMTDEEIAQVPDGVVMVPLAAGAVALAYNVPDAPEGLRLSREVYAGIFLGEIQNWNDPKIAACNPGTTLPDLPITVVRRAVSSGTTFVFTRHLSAVSQAWDEGPGTGTTVEWPVGVPAKRNADIADRIRQTPGAIGYLEYGYAKDARLTVAALENRSGEYVTPVLEHARAALGVVVLPENLRGFVSDPQDPNAYPVVSYTWLLCYRKYEDPKVGAALRQLIRHCLTTGQESSAELGFVPLPEDVAETVLRVAESRVGVADEQ
jgi:phosphate transport system substrate-binding protein